MKRRYGVCLMSLALMAGFLVPALSAGAQELDTTIEVNGGNIIKMAPGATTVVPIIIKNIKVSEGAEGLAAFDLTLNWTPGVIRVDCLMASTEASDSGFTITQGPIDNTLGTMKFVGCTTAYSVRDLVLATLQIAAIGNEQDSGNITLVVRGLFDDSPANIINRAVGAPMELTGLRGDTDGNGVVDIGDASWIAQFCVGLRELEGASRSNAAGACNDGEEEGNDTPNMLDALYIVQRVVGQRDANFLRIE